jgi:exonuclease I
MSLLQLEEAKTLLGVTHAFDDARIQLLINSASSEVLSFLNREDDDQWDEETDQVNAPDDVKLSVFLLVQAAYEGSVDDMSKIQSLMEHKLFRYRKGLGV